MKKAIRIKTVSQWHLLKQLNSNLGKMKIPREVMRKVYHILSSKKLGKDGFIVLCTQKIHDDFIGLEEAVGIYPYQCHWDEKVDEILIKQGNNAKPWNISYGKVKGQKTKIAVVYPTKACE